MRSRGLAGVVLGAAAVLTGACASDPFSVPQPLPAPRALVRRHATPGTSRVLRCTYAQAYRAAARTFDRTPYYSVTTTLPLAELYRELGALDASQIVAILDASFSGEGERTWSETDHRPGFRELRPQAALTGLLSILYASQPGETAQTLDEQGHGMLTYHLLRGLRGEAAGGGSRLDLEELAHFVYREVRADAKARGRVQGPHLDSTGPLTPVWTP